MNPCKLQLLLTRLPTPIRTRERPRAPGAPAMGFGEVDQLGERFGIPDPEKISLAQTKPCLPRFYTSKERWSISERRIVVQNTNPNGT